MNHWIAIGFLVAGIILAIVEIATLTFYLAALSFAALVAALAAWLFAIPWWQAAIVFAVAAVIALPLAHLLRRHLQANRASSALDDMDRGATVTIAENAKGALRVQYRDSLWEAVWEGAGEPRVGNRARIVAREGSRLRIKAGN